MERLKRKFFLQETLKVAKSLLGKFLIRQFKGKLLIGKIVETEAYIGPKDRASHAYSFRPQSEKEKLKIIFRNWFRIKQSIENPQNFVEKIINQKCKVTDRNLAEYLKGGHIYIYLVYGKYYQLNITTFKEGYPECVLIRALEPIKGFQGDSNGPGKLCSILKLDHSFWGEDLTKSKRIWVGQGVKVNPKQIVARPRIGIDYAGKDKKLKWRFYLSDNPWVSQK